jgi:hypothetical protein
MQCARVTSSSVLITNSPSRSNMIMGVSGSQNSLMNCLHIPHGLAGLPGAEFVATARALRSPYFRPCTTAVPRATRSAHVPTGYAAFSTLAPMMMAYCGFLGRRAHPTLKWEYGPTYNRDQYLGGGGGV